MKKVLSMLLCIAVVLCCVACGNSGGAQDSAGTGELSIAHYAVFEPPITNWDPAIEISTGITTMCNIYETLFHYDSATGELEPVLATSAEVSDDGLTWTFHLREGVTFHDGTPFNADAVKFSVERCLEMAQGASYIWAAVEQINVIDDYTVEFKCSFPSDLDMVSAAQFAAFIVSPSIQDYEGDYFNDCNACGTGPYMLESSNLNDDVILTRYEDYWGGWEGEHFDKIILKHYGEATTRRQLVETGETDVTGFLSPEDIEALKQNPNVNISAYTSYESLIMLYDCEDEILSNPLVRKALSCCIPYEDIIEYAAGGYGVQTHGCIPEGVWAYNGELPQYSHDLELAKELFAQAGVDPASLNLLLTYTSGIDEERKSAELFQNELMKLGITMEIRALPFVTGQMELGASDNTEERQDIFMMYWYPDYINPSCWYEPVFYSQDPVVLGFSYYNNPEMDALIDQAKYDSIMDRAQGKLSWDKVQEKFVEDCPGIFVFDKSTVFATSNTLSGLQYDPAYTNCIFFYDCYRGE